MKQVFLLTLSCLLLIVSGFAQVKSKEEVARIIAKSNMASAKSLSQNTVEYAIKDSHIDESLGIEYVYLQQTYKGIKVYNVVKSLALKNNELQYSAGNFINDIATKAPSEKPSLTAAVAINKAIVHLGLPAVSNLQVVSNTFATNKKIVFNTGGISRQNITAELLWSSNDDGKSIHLVWNIFIEPTKGSDMWYLNVDANNGSIINKGNYTVYEKNTVKRTNKTEWTSANTACKEALSNSKSFMHLMAPPAPSNTITSATYNVIQFPNEHRYIDGTAIVTNPWTLAGANNNATTYGWHYDGVKSYNLTYGNNVHVYDDSLNKNTPGRPDTSTTAIPSLTFNFTPDFTQEPTTTINRKFAEANLFYWNNLYHDLLYQYGFTEAAGNFQSSNLNRGGVAGDYVRCEAQDGSGTDNSNFSALPDGQTAREQMYLFTPNQAATTGNTINITSPSAASYTYIESAFSTANKLATVGAVTGYFAYFNDASGGTHYACAGAPSNNIRGKIALIDRNNCNFTVKVLAAQTAGAIGVIMVNRVDSLLTMGGTDNTITIPAVLITKSDGDSIKAKIAAGQVLGSINVAKTGVHFDGDLDNSIVCHEATHGLSLRLTGGASTTSCLNNAEQGGEGWSDYVSLMMITNWANATLTDDTIAREIGTYALDQTPAGGPGVRNFPYTTDMTQDPHTYADVADSNAGEVHYIGEVWCSALWDMTWNIIKQEGVINSNLFDPTSGGNAKALQLVVQGLKLQPCSPGFIDARNAILAADSILYKNAHKCAIWNAFARRGMGYSASQGSSSSVTDQTVAFDVPPCVVPVTLISFTGTPQTTKVALQWSTASEVNSKEFVVEHSADNVNWNTVGTVAAANKAGVHNYALTDYQPINGANYYRLKMVDKDGSFKYSNVVVISFDGKVGLSIYPNPVKQTLTAELFRKQAEKVTVRLTDITGRVLQNQSVSLQNGNNVFHVNTSTLSKGTYLIVVDGSSKEVRQFIKD